MKQTTYQKTSCFLQGELSLSTCAIISLFIWETTCLSFLKNTWALLESPSCHYLNIYEWRCNTWHPKLLFFFLVKCRNTRIWLHAVGFCKHGCLSSTSAQALDKSTSIQGSHVVTSLRKFESSYLMCVIPGVSNFQFQIWQNLMSMEPWAALGGIHNLRHTLRGAEGVDEVWNCVTRGEGS